MCERSYWNLTTLIGNWQQEPTSSIFYTLCASRLEYDISSVFVRVSFFVLTKVCLVCFVCIGGSNVIFLLFPISWKWIIMKVMMIFPLTMKWWQVGEMSHQRKKWRAGCDASHRSGREKKRIIWRWPSRWKRCCGMWPIAIIVTEIQRVRLGREWPWLCSTPRMNARINGAACGQIAG